MANFPTSIPSFTTKANGQVVDASHINSPQDEIIAIGTWLLGQALTTYTPTWTGAGSNPAIGNGTLQGKYFQLGKVVYVDIHVLMGSTTTFGSGVYSWALPVTAADLLGQALSAYLFDSGTQDYIGMGVLATTGTVSVRTHAGVQSAAATYPYTFAINDTIRITGWYRAA